MNKDLKNIIIDTSRSLFEQEGYGNVTMRQIADACGISVGNLTYYYHRKEDILMTIHDRIMNAFTDSIAAEERLETGLSGYFAAEYAFMNYIIHDEALSSLYNQVINVPALRSSYIQEHHELFLSYVPSGRNDPLQSAATAAMSGMEFQLADSGYLIRSFDDSMQSVFRCRCLFCEGKLTKDAEKQIMEGICHGKQLAEHMRKI
ncbi:MAG: TetR/AcrR family transcriptional regulator [Bulleidia sp.]